MPTDTKLKPGSRRRKVPTFYSSNAARELQKSEVNFVQAITGSDSDVLDSLENAQAALHLLKRCVHGNWAPEFNNVVSAEVSSQGEPYLMAIMIGQRVADCFRTHGGLSIIRLIRQLQTDQVLIGDGNLVSSTTAQSLIFNTIGWISMLYQPAQSLAGNPGSNNFRIATYSRQSSLRSRVPAEKAERPLDELLRACGSIFSDMSQVKDIQERSASQDHLERKIQVSYLNAHALKTLANMEFIWVDSLGAHLDFDPSRPAISIFRCPSFCKIHQSEESILAKMFVNMDYDNEQPSNCFSAQKYVAEVQLTYRLLFRDDSSARKLYVQQERNRAALTFDDHGASVDPYLDELCGRYLPNAWFSFTASVRDSYDADADFPIFKDRLKRVQNYMHGIQPNRFMSLWRDRRDLRLWYTIWTVIILGITGLIAQFIGLALSAAQVNLAQKALAAQLQQNHDSECSV